MEERGEVVAEGGGIWCVVICRLNGACGALVEMNGALSRGLAAIPLAVGATGEMGSRLMADVALVGVVFQTMGCSDRRACRGVDSMVGFRGIVVLVGDGVGFTIGGLGCFVP